MHSRGTSLGSKILQAIASSMYGACLAAAYILYILTGIYRHTQCKTQHSVPNITTFSTSNYILQPLYFLLRPLPLHKVSSSIKFSNTMHFVPSFLWIAAYLLPLFVFVFLVHLELIFLPPIPLCRARGSLSKRRSIQQRSLICLFGFDGSSAC